MHGVESKAGGSYSLWVYRIWDIMLVTIKAAIVAVRFPENWFPERAQVVKSDGGLMTVMKNADWSKRTRARR